MDMKRRTTRIGLNLSQVDSYIFRFRLPTSKKLNGEFVSAESSAVNFSDETGGIRNCARSGRLDDRLECGEQGRLFRGESQSPFQDSSYNVECPRVWRPAYPRLRKTLQSRAGPACFQKLRNRIDQPDACAASVRCRRVRRASKLHNSCRSRSLGSRESRYATRPGISRNQLGLTCCIKLFPGPMAFVRMLIVKAQQVSSIVITIRSSDYAVHVRPRWFLVS